MFEQSTLSSGSPSKRLWATCVGVTGEALLVTFAILAPMLWPQVLPRISLVTSLLPPVPPGRPKAAPEHPRTTAAVHPQTQFHMGAVVMPTSIPQHPAMIIDPPPEVSMSGIGVVGAPYSPGEVSSGGILIKILGGDGPPPRPTAAPVSRPPEPPTPAAIKRVKLGGVVQAAALLRRVDPVYPQIAKQMRVSGPVELEGVIGTDGHIRELRVVSGHPLLVRAAIDAVSQWTYAPTRLNSELVEVITSITVTFHLN